MNAPPPPGHLRRAAGSAGDRDPLPRVAVVGLSAIMPDARDVDAFWRNIAAGVNCVREVPPTHWLLADHYDPRPEAPDRTYSNRGAFLGEVDFDPMAYGIPPAILPATDPAQLLALVAARALLEDVARGDFSHLDLDRTAVVLGTSSTTQLAMTLATRSTAPMWRKALREAGIEESKVEEVCGRIADHFVGWQESSFPGLLGNVVAGRIANRFNLGGMNCITDAACASSLAALSVGLSELYLGNADMVVTGGVDILNDPMMYTCFSKTPAMSPTGDCRPFARDADGTIMGEGIAMLALKRLADAERDGNRIYATIAGLGSGSDGTAKSVYAPVASGQARAIRRAYAIAGFDPGSVGLMEAHGTATRVGDQVEVAALRSVFPEEERRGYCALGSVKSQIGHTKAAAGAAGLVKAVLALHNRVLPPTINVAQLNEALELDRSAFYVNTELRPWVQAGDRPRRASVSSFGFGGADYHVALEEYRGASPARAVTPFAERLLLFSADTTAALIERIAAVEQVRAAQGFAAAVVAALDGFDAAAPCRLAAVATATDVAALLAAASARIANDPAEGFSAGTGLHYAATRAVPGKVAFLFPGQGSQHPGMGAALMQAFGEAADVWDAHAARNLHAAVFPPPDATPDARAAAAQRLTATETAQPALAMAALAGLAVLRAAGVGCDMAAGHSFGELPALYAAGVIDAATLLDLGNARGAAMAATGASEGTMLAIEASDAQCATLLDDWAERIFLANRNAPGQIAVSGRYADIDAFADDLATRGLKAIRLPVGAAFHSPLVAPAAARFAGALAEAAIGAAAMPVFSNLDAGTFPHDAAAVRTRLAEQIAAPIRFADMIAAMHDAGARIFVEVGPGSVLTGLVGRSLSGQPHLALTTAPRGATTPGGLLGTLGALAVAGVPLDRARLAEWDRDTPPQRPRPAHAIGVSSVPIGRIYPPKEGEAGLPPPNIAPPAATPTAPMAVPATGLGEIDGAATDLLRDIHDRSAAAHERYLQAMSDSHAAFLEVARQTLDWQTGSLTPGLSAGVVPPPAPAASAAQPAVAVVKVAPAPAPVIETVVAEPDDTPSSPADMTELLMTTVAEKTGYPRELLRLDMELEAGLGIDSIKRMEIFGSLQDLYPALATVDVARVGEVRTFADIVALIEDSDAVRTAPEVVEAASTPAPAPPSRAVRRVASATAQPAPGRLLPGLAASLPIAVAAVDPAEDAATAALAAALAEAGHAGVVTAIAAAAADAIVLLVAPSGPGDAAAGVEGAVRAIALARNAAAGDGRRAALVIVGGGGVTGASADIANPWFAGFGALARSLAAEWPDTCVRYIDAGPRPPDGALDGWAARIVAELETGGDTPLVALPDAATRLVPRLLDEPVKADADPLADNDFVIVSGGGRGITAATLRALAARRPLRFLLLGRTRLSEEPTLLVGVDDEAELKRRLIMLDQADGTPLDFARIGAAAAAIRSARAIRATVSSLEAAGSAVRYACADVGDAAAVGRAVAEARADWGAPAAIVHAAGVTADKLVIDKTDAQARLVLETKLLGLHNLLAATQDDPLRLIALFSSVVARAGNAGQADYAIANEVLNAVARAEAARRGAACVVKSIGWGPWDGGLVTPAIADHLRSRNFGLLSLATGADAFVDELRDRTPGGVDPLILASEAVL